MDLLGVSIGVQEVPFYLIKVYVFNGADRTTILERRKCDLINYHLKEKESGYVSYWERTSGNKGR